jgi:hypothetical protein
MSRRVNYRLHYPTVFIVIIVMSNDVKSGEDEHG